MNQNPTDIDLTLAIAGNVQRELMERSRRERLLEEAHLATAHHHPRRALGHWLIRTGYALMAPRDRVPPRNLNPVRF